jgi:predicted N-acetyltransferase YhbS
MYKEYPDMISYLVSLDDEKNITGIIGFEPCLLEDRNFFYISPLEVREKFRGQKIASSLLEEINKLSRRFKLDGLTLFCREDLVFFYSKRGFRIVASIDRENRKEYLMVKENIIEK